MKKFLTTLFAAACVAGIAHAAEISLFYAPSFDAQKALTLDEADPVFQTAQPAPNAAKGWFVVRYRALHTGFTPEANVMKDLILKPGAPIYAAPDKAAHVMGLVPPKAQMAVSSVENGWAKTQFTATLPLYFYKAAAPVKTAVSSREPTTIASDATRGQFDGQPRFYQGVMKRHNFRIGLQQTNYEYELENLEGRVVAYLDFKDLISPSPVMDFANKRVQLYGVGEHYKVPPHVVIKVKQIQLLDGGVSPSTGTLSLPNAPAPEIQ